MATVGLRELRQDASELVRRVEGGEQIDITVSGRLAASLVPVAPRRWQRWSDVAEVLVGRPDADWARDQEFDGRFGDRPLGARTVRAILDTSVLIASDLHPLDGDLAVSAVSLAELHFGVLVAADPAVRAERLRRLAGIQRTFDPLPVDDVVAASFGELAAAVVAAGRQPRARTADLLIAATAHAHKARLYTRNPRDFVGIEDLVHVVPV